MRVIAAVTAAALLAVTGVAATAAPAAEPEPKPTVVLVHGAFAESASWSGVVSRLHKRGYPVIAAANPLRGLASDSEHVSRIVKNVKGPVVLAGHSYGGSVISNAARGNANVKGLVFVAAFAPDKGETALGLSSKFPGSTLGETLEQVPLGDGTADLSIRQDRFRQQFAADLSPADAALNAATQRPIRDAALAEGSGDPAWRSVPSWFLLAGADRNIPLAAQRFMAERAKARQIAEIGGASHSVGISHPGAVVDLIVKAASS
ncbi:alpha/beta fold hydrolase [Allokutzneria oryzae]|uniref:Alpha/beta fold hydrolase n=1 Tax=Allokutzneria oryzae TaxID=1378989 RepID=A0ABV6A6R8_9PSEU